ncbi:unnamed protein product [Linum tenue]|uniref:GRAM domain-containing protein n=1 Tax=Linum tenue TaxID=586396 RepID=A0AAV0K3D5_9ROSI|nr:unnamed protein product [Linum tenue]
MLTRINSLGKKADTFANSVKEHGKIPIKIKEPQKILNWIELSLPEVQSIDFDKFAVRLGPKISETVKGKLSLGAKILQGGGVERIFRQLFSVDVDEKLLKASQCYLSTTAGPIAGLLFISSCKLAFCSERSIKFSSPNGESIRKIERVNQSENAKKPSQKYMEVVTVDGFDFWFMGFLSYKKAFKCVEQAMTATST